MKLTKEMTEFLKNKESTISIEMYEMPIKKEVRI